MSYTLKKRFVAAVTFDGLSIISFIREYKKKQYTLDKYSLYISNKYIHCLCGVETVFFHVDI